MSGKLTIWFYQLVPAVTELVIAELMYLQWMDPKEPVYVYINCTGTTRDDGERVSLLLIPYTVIASVFPENIMSNTTFKQFQKLVQTNFWFHHTLHIHLWGNAVVQFNYVHTCGYVRGRELTLSLYVCVYIFYLSLSPCTYTHMLNLFMRNYEACLSFSSFFQF